MNELEQFGRDEKARHRASVATERSTGVVVAMLDATHAKVDLGDKAVVALIPGSVSGVVDGCGVVVRVSAVSVVESVVSGLPQGAYWAGALSAGFTPTADHYQSLAMTVATRSRGLDLGAAWSAHCIVVPETRDWLLDLVVGYNASTAGSRLAGWWINPATTSHDSLNTPSAGRWLRVRQMAAATGSTHAAAQWLGTLPAGTLLMPICRTTGATSVLSSRWDTELTIEAR